MPVSHIGLTVSHLPTSSSFFLSALQPLGYRFIAQHGNQIGLGISDADFFLCQETPGVKAGAAHIAFTAPSRTAVRDFYTAALNAGGRPNGAPATRDEETGYFNAAILDFDGNSIEVVYRKEPDVLDDGTVIEHSRVLTWQKDVAESTRDDKSVVSARDNKTVVSVRSTKSAKPSIGPGSMVRSVSAPLALAQPSVSTSSTSALGDNTAKKIIGTLIGAAAGAAVAYAMVKSEQDSANKEAEFNAFMQAKAQATQAIEQATQPKSSKGGSPSVYERSPKSVHSAHRHVSDNASSYSRSQGPRAIEPAPQSYHSPTYTSVPPTQVTERRAIEYIPAASIAPSRAHFATNRSVTSPEMSTYSKPRSTAPSSLISSFVADEPDRRKSEGSVHSHHSHSSKKSKSPKSSYTETSKHTSKSRSRAASPARSSSKAGSIVGSILGRNPTAETVHTGASKSYYDDQIIDINDSDSVAPSDSISNAGSSSRRRHRSSSGKSGSGSTVSKHSSSSKHSKSSRHSHGSKKSHSHREEREYVASPLHEEWIDADEFVDKDSGYGRVMSEPSDASTVKPVRRDSGMGRWADGHGYAYGDGGVSGGRGDVGYGGARSLASLPVRGITESMIGESRGGKQGRRSVVSYAMGQ